MLRLLCSSAILAVAACGLIDTDIADFDLSLPEKELTVDTMQWELSEAETMPAVDCSESSAVCSAGIGEYCGAEGICFGSCDDADQTCRVEVLVSLWHTFDLAAEKPELQDIDGQPLVRVDIDRVSYDVVENTFSVDSPEFTVYVAPQGVMAPGDPQARAIGTIPGVPAMTTQSDVEIELTGDGREILAGFMKAYSTPFNLIVGSTVTLEAGDPIPTGKLVAVVRVTATAGL